MNSTTFIFLTGLMSGLVVLTLTPLVLFVARHLGLVDTINARKVHTQATPRVGGVAIAAGTLAASTAGLTVMHLVVHAVPGDLSRGLVMLLATSAFVFAIGLVDDIRSIPSRYKALALFGAALALSVSGVNIQVVVLQDAAWWEFNWLSTHVATVFWIMLVAVAINFIDGLDGLASGLVLLASATLAGLLLLNGHTAVASLAVALASALAGFLVFNWRPAKIFMGDGGSLFIGFLIGGLTVLANPLLGSMKALGLPALALGVPLLDTALTFFRRRYMQRRSLFAAERGHIHHVLLDRGLKHKHAVIAIHAVSLIGTLIGLGAMVAASAWAAILYLLAVAFYAAFFWFAGSIHTIDMIRGFRQKRIIDSQRKVYLDHFHDLQLEFNQARDFSSWWGVVCRVAEQLDFASLELPLIGRDGKSKTLTWSRIEEASPEVARLSAVVPIAERRQETQLMARVEVLALDSIESAGHRVSLFSRLMSDHSLASLSRDQDTSASGAVTGASGDSSAAHHTNKRPAGLVTSGPLKGKRVAVVHDFLYTYAGAERVLEQMVELYPECDLYALFDFLIDGQRQFIRNKRVTTTFLQRLPLARKKHRAFLPLMPLAIEQLDLSGYDVIISSSYIAAKGVITGPEQVHICYCHSPARYAWDLQHQYLDQKKLGFGPRGLLSRSILHYIRNWDVRSATGVDVFLANSGFVGRRIQKVYRREAEIVYPPVDTEFFCPDPDEDSPVDGEYYVTASRLVPYKRIDLIVAAFARMPDRKLVVVGEGPEHDAIAQIAGPNVEMVGYQSNESLRRYMRHAKAFLFAAEEDFGIVPVEAMACGTPVIAYGHGGVCETVQSGKTGRFFEHQTASSLCSEIDQFEESPTPDRHKIVEHVRERFGIKAFRARLQAMVLQALRNPSFGASSGEPGGAGVEPGRPGMTVTMHPDA